ncbi:MAG: hypothetical protein LW650_11135 [Planctomycetaceae bacterium]|jgi:hypothetical protein|nr:hypothetical protein [Phycisphaerales bacterium]MCE2653994.1 hypothetical protein [Planctomycetaceae bacterium]
MHTHPIFRFAPQAASAVLLLAAVSLCACNRAPAPPPPASQDLERSKTRIMTDLDKYAEPDPRDLEDERKAAEKAAPEAGKDTPPASPSSPAAPAPTPPAAPMPGKS